MSPVSAGQAVKLGYTNVKVMVQGVPAWKKLGRAVVASQQFVETGNIVLVDLRSADEYAKGHIPGAYNIPQAKLAEAENQFPEKKIAPIVFYGDGAEKASLTARKWGYKNAAVVNGGLQGWIEAGKKLDTTPSPDKITWVRKLAEGEVSIADFRKIAEENPADQVILDVRTNDEVAAGKFANSLHIPLDEIGNKMSTLSKDKEYLIHCTTGVRSEMAYQELKKAGFKVRYLLANVECDEDGCEISE
jgi:rhodanese-related sulfurtransferase